MPVSENKKKAVLNELKKMRPLMDVDSMKKEFLRWLDQFELPAYPDAHSWADCLKTFPPREEEHLMNKGLKLRLALKLCTVSNQYLVSILESLEPCSRGIYIISVHKNWHTGEKRLMKIIEENYAGSFNDTLRAQHSVWIQTFKADQLHEALNSCASAILGNELTAHTVENNSGEPIDIPARTRVKFPKQDD